MKSKWVVKNKWALGTLVVGALSSLALWIVLMATGVTDENVVNALLPLLMGLMFIAITCGCWLLPFRPSTLGTAPEHEMSPHGPIHEPDQALVGRQSTSRVAFRSALFAAGFVCLCWLAIGTVSSAAADEPYLTHTAFNHTSGSGEPNNRYDEWFETNIFRNHLATSSNKTEAKKYLSTWKKEKDSLSGAVSQWAGSPIDDKGSDQVAQLKYFHLYPKNALERAPAATLASFLQGVSAADQKVAEEKSVSPAASAKAVDKVIREYAYEVVWQRQASYGRHKILVMGPIQIATFWVFFMALSLLAMRRSTIEWQESVADRFEEFPSASGFDSGRAALANRQEQEGQDLIPRFPDRWPVVPVKLNMVEYLVTAADRESTVVDQFSGYVANERRGAHSYMLGALRLAWRELRSRLLLDRAGATAAMNAAEARLAQLRKRIEERIQRVEYSVIGYCLWAMPIIGFIGTVVGISNSLGSADKVVRATDQAAQGAAVTLVTGQLGVAFDTTLVALVCSLPVMLLMYTARARESRFLLNVEQRILRSAL